MSPRAGPLWDRLSAAYAWSRTAPGGRFGGSCAPPAATAPSRSGEASSSSLPQDPIPAALRDALAEVNRPEERRVRQHWAVMAKDLIQTGLFILLMVVIQTYLPADPLIHNLTFYLSLAAVVRFTVQVIQWWMERIVITDKRVMRPPACSTTRSA